MDEIKGGKRGQSEQLKSWTMDAKWSQLGNTKSETEYEVSSKKLKSQISFNNR